MPVEAHEKLGYFLGLAQFLTQFSDPIFPAHFLPVALSFLPVVPALHSSQSVDLAVVSVSVQAVELEHVV